MNNLTFGKRIVRGDVGQMLYYHVSVFGEIVQNNVQSRLYPFYSFIIVQVHRGWGGGNCRTKCIALR